MVNCVFCNPQDTQEGFLDEIKNFYHRANVRGAIALGHSMIISKKHFSCFGEMPFDLSGEYQSYKEKIERRVKRFFGDQIKVEQGIQGQSISHAHLHFFPRVSCWYDFSKKDFISFVPEEIPITKAQGIEEICEVFRQEGQYVSIEENGQLYICHTKEYTGKLRVVRDFPSKLTGNTTLLYWDRVSEEEKKKNEEWIKETIQKLRKR